MSIIDFLQTFRAKKKMELLLKSVFVVGRENNEISSIEPRKYAGRFFNFMKNEVLVDFEVISSQSI